MQEKSSTIQKDNQLEEVLTKYNLLSLYDIFEKNSITSEVIWDLETDELEKMGLSIGDKLKYKKAKKQNTAVKGKYLVILPSSFHSFLNHLR